MADPLLERYDRWLYPAGPVSESHPDHLAGIARLAGLNPAPVATASVLELGCGDGANLIPLAARWPGGRFLGIDLAPRQIARGRHDVAALGLPNVELRVGDLRAGLEVERHDYVLAVGVLSWVDRDVREALLSAVAGSLAEGGLAYVSYNSWPGWHRLQGVRDILRRHVQGIDDVSEAVAAARALVEELRPSWQMQPALVEALGRIDTGGDAYLLHEFLAPHNTAFWFDDVVRLVQGHGLHVLGTASMADHREPGRIQHRAYADQRAADAVVLARRPRVPVEAFEVVRSCWVSTDLTVGSDHFRTPAGVTVQTEAGATREALETLCARSPEALPVMSLLATAAENADQVLDDLTLLVFAGVVRLHTEAPPLRSTVDDRPVASALSRIQAVRQPWVTDALHRKVLLRPDQADLLKLLDGRTTVDELATRLGRDVRPTLENFARNALLVVE